MVLIAFVGELGAGKTLALTYLAWRNYNKGQTIYANYHLGFPFKFIDSPEKIEEMREGFFAGDELWNWCDCVSDDTKIMTHNDAINVSDCINANPVQSVCFDTMKIENSNISHVLKRLPEKNEKIILLKTSTKSLKASKNHRLFKFDGLQLRESLLKDLKAGDYILTADAINPANENKMDLELAQFLGYVFGDGTIYFTPDETHWKKRRAAIRCYDASKKLLKIYGNIIKRKYGLRFFIKKSNNSKSYRMTITSRNFMKKIAFLLKDDKNVFLDKWGIRFRDIPEAILHSNNKILAAFLRGLYDAEGYVIFKTEKSSLSDDGKATQTRINLLMNRHIDFDRLKHIFLRFGIRSTVVNKYFKGHGKFKPTFSKNIIIRDRISILRFAKNIGFESPRKSQMLSKCCMFIHKRKNQFNKARTYPFQMLMKSLSDNICKRHSISLSSIEHNLYDKYKLGYFRKNFKYNIGKDVLKRTLDAIEKEYGKFSEIDYMRKIMNSNMLLEKITSIREIRPKGYLYDLSVPSHENYIANGIVVHNSRVSGSKKNKLISAILLKSRKRGINIGYTTQHLSQVDKRMRNITDFIAIPQLTPQETWCRLRVYHAVSGQLIKMYKFETAPIFKLYSTNEEVKDLSWA